MKKIIFVFLPLMITLVGAGCVTAMLGGKSGTRFDASLNDVYTAVLDTLQDENMPVTKKSISASTASVSSSFQNGTPLHVVMKRLSPQYTEVYLRAGSFGQDHRAYDFMKKIESRIQNSSQSNKQQ